MNTTTLSDLILRCRERADEVNSGFVSDSELTRLINTKLQKLWDFLATQYNENLVLPPVTLTLVTDQEWVSLPIDFKQAVQVFAVESDRRVIMPRFSLGDLATELDPFAYIDSRIEPLGYRIVGKRLYFRPVNPSIDSIELWYVPEMRKLENSYDRVDAHLPDGWEECIVNGVAGLVKLKKEADPGMYFNLESQYYQELSAYASDRDAGQTHRVRDITGWIR